MRRLLRWLLRFSVRDQSPFPSFYVTDYGAVGDGVTDDTAAILRAIDAAIAADGGVIWFANGSYIIYPPHGYGGTAT